MKITFLGTGADTAYPLPFCNCTPCIAARALGGKNIRKRSSILINDDLLIDLGPDSAAASFQYKKDLSKISYLLQTHSHADHFDPAHLSTRIPEYATMGVSLLKLCASKATINKMSEALRAIGYISDLFDIKEQEKLKIEIQAINHYQTINLGKYKVTALPTEHDSTVDSLIYIISENKTTILYGTDMEALTEETWGFLVRNNFKLNIVILDHTYGPDVNGGGHLNANKVVGHIKRMKQENIINDKSIVLATHISHEGNPLHEELSEYAHTRGYEVAFDGLEI